MPIVDGQYEKRTRDDFFEIIEDALKEEFPNANFNENSVFWTLTDVLSEVLAQNQEPALETVFESGYIETAEGEALDLLGRMLGLTRQPPRRATGWVRFTAPEGSNVEIEEDFVVQTQGTNPIRFRTTETIESEDWEDITDPDEALNEDHDIKAEVNIQANEMGNESNIGAETLKVMPNPPVGEIQVINPEPTGNPDYQDLDGNTLTIGRPEESDAAFRERLLEVTTIGGGATRDAIHDSILEAEPQVESITIFENKQDTPKSNADWDDDLPPHSFEVIVHGGEEDTIGQAIFDAKAVTAWDVGGRIVDDTQGVTVEAESELTGENYEINFSRPNVLTIEIEADIVVTDIYVGEDRIKNNLVNYIGGVRTDGETRLGLNAGEEVYKDLIEDNIVAKVRGVKGIQELTVWVDGVELGWDTVNGLDAIGVLDTEVATVNANDITINETEI